ncbi:Methyltransferase [Fulvivirga imtechensis AK7]|uniref:Methyltransferase n=1 Tax=Fulvivirga imtechensis AK7 TaxID=1237149 RepID=L8JS01_9BACT|nr:Methyltransferase [Fulvivirga imtechensis AK7]
MQLEEFVPPSKIYEDYAYFSSYSDSWLRHVKDYTEKMAKRFSLTSKSQVIELASNDGYLLQYFREKNIPVLGIEPAANVAEYAIRKGIKTEIKFFGNETVFEIIMNHGEADLLIGNNVLAHVPDINDFVSAMKILLKPEGVITMEFPHLLKLIDGNQFDTVYHEHFSYLSFSSVERIFSYHGLTLFDVEELPTHGGSLRIYACHKGDNSKKVSTSVRELRMKEFKAGMETIEYYQQFTERVKETKRNILEFLISAKRKGKSIAGYGAPGKGNTLLNYCGIRTDFIDYTVDRNPHKQGNYLPGTLIPIYHPDMIIRTKPDYVFILPWNLKEEIMENFSFIGEWGGKFVVPIPELRVYDPRAVEMSV